MENYFHIIAFLRKKSLLGIKKAKINIVTALTTFELNYDKCW